MQPVLVTLTMNLYIWDILKKFNEIFKKYSSECFSIWHPSVYECNYSI